MVSRSRSVRKKRRPQIRIRVLLLAFAMLLLALGLTPLIPYPTPKGEYKALNSTNPPSKPLRIVYFDSLYADYPNGELINLAERLKAAYNTSIYLGKNATVAQLLEIIRSQDFDVLIIRSHSAPMETGFPLERGVAIFGERADEQKYFVEQLSNLVRRARPLWGGEAYYALTPLAFEGINLSNKIIILLGCNGFDDYMPRLIAGSGGIYASWTGYVSVEENDKVAKAILTNLLHGRHPLYGVLGAVDGQYGSRFLAAAPSRR